ncbi:MAG: hypothetical protein C0404_10770 [Verrucomicrobia bacterium]|nr:hypothetical protein [Verrucomicrobiota bacterium]
MTVDVLIVTDLHYAGPGAAPPALAQRKCRFGLELARRAVRDALRFGKPDVILLLGDLVEDGHAACAAADLAEIHKEISSFGIQTIAIPGNHDAGTAGEIFWNGPEQQEINGHVFVPFSDNYDESTDAPIRPASAMKNLLAAKGSGKPVIVLQHAVVLPELHHNYPYNFLESEKLAEAYSESGVCLSLSGHYHAGLDPVVHGVTYLTCPSICEDPFRYTRLKMENGAIASREVVSLSLKEFPDLFDAHIHTQFAHCAQDITTAGALERLELFGLHNAGLMEHADHLYVPRTGFWGRKDTDNPVALRQAIADGHCRYPAFRQQVCPLHSDHIFIGLEAEPAIDGRGLALFEEDRAGIDYLLGAIHNLDEKFGVQMSVQETDRQFMARTRQLVESGINILAHPFRYFPRLQKRTAPPDLYRPVADLLAAGGVAAEINFHQNVNDPEFFTICIERGVKIALGTDSHCLIDVADLRPHVDLLRQLGVIGRLEEVLWRPPARHTRHDHQNDDLNQYPHPSRANPPV